MLKLARNALVSLAGSCYDSDGGEIQWKFFRHLHNLQEDEGLNAFKKMKDWTFKKMKDWAPTILKT